MKQIFIRIIPFLLLAAFSSCGNTGNILKQMIGMDPEPPPGYNPIFITDVQPIESSKLGAPSFVVSRIEPHKSNVVRVYLHLVDSNRVYLSGAAKSKWKKIWCEVIDSSTTGTKVIEKYSIKESERSDRRPQSIALVMDHSGSMGENRSQAVQTAVDNFIRNFKQSDDAVAIVKYDDSVGVEAGLTSNTNELLSKFQKNGMKGYGGQTASLNAIDAGIAEVIKAKPSLERVVMVFTDGMDNTSTISKDSIISYARHTNTKLCAIDFGYAISQDFMDELARETDGTYHHIYRANDFDLVFKDIYRRLEQYYVLEYEPEDFGSHVVRVKLCLPDTTLLADGKYDNTPYAGLTTLMNVYFDLNKSTLQPKSDPAIHQVAEMMRNNPRMEIEVRGHTDNVNKTKDVNYNQKLSQQRADAVKKALIAHDVHADRISAKGFGASQPVADNSTEEGRAKNRRTEFIVLKK